MAVVISIAVAVLIAAGTVAAIAVVDVLAAEVAVVVVDVPEHPAGAIFPLRNMPLRKAANATIAVTSLVVVIAVALTSAVRAATSAAVVPKAAVTASPALLQDRPARQKTIFFFPVNRLQSSAIAR